MKHLQKLGYIAIGSILTIAIMGTALAATGLSITVDPTIKIQVNGSEFKPKDATGKDVMTFSYQGTTYAPLRALAEAYGLEVGYDAAKNMATVGEKGNLETPTTPTTPDKPAGDYSDWTAEEEKAYQEFVGMWEVEIRTSVDAKIGNVKAIDAQYNGTMTRDELVLWMKSCGSLRMNKFAQRIMEKNYSGENLLKLIFVPAETPGQTPLAIWTTTIWNTNGNKRLGIDFENDIVEK